MSRFDEQLDRDLPVIAERVTPSPDAWASIQQRIADRHTERETETIMLTDNTMPTRRWPLLAAAAAAVALTAGAIAVIGTGGDEDDIPATPVPPVDTAPPPEVVDEDAAPPPDETPELLPEPSAEVDTTPTPAVEPLPPELSGFLRRGTRYETTALGVPITLSTDDPSYVTLGGSSGYVGLHHDVVAHDIEFMRISGWLSADESVDAEMPIGSIDALDIDGWLEQADVDVADASQTTVGGFPAEVRDVTVRPDSALATPVACPDHLAPCFFAASLTTAVTDAATRRVTPALETGRAYRLMLVDIGDPEPVLIISSSVSEAWIRGGGQAIIDAVEFGEVGPVTDTTPVAVIVDEVPSSRGDVVLPGRYVVDMLDDEVTFDLGRPYWDHWYVGHHEPGVVVLGTDDAGFEVVQIQRIGSLRTADEAAVEATDLLGSIEPDDVDGWLAANPAVIVDERSTTEVGGFPAEFVAMRVDPVTGPGFPCGPDRCIRWASRSATTRDEDAPIGVAGISSAQQNFMWFVDVGDDEPIVVTLSTQTAQSEQWFDDVARPIVESMAISPAD